MKNNFKNSIPQFSIPLKIYLIHIHLNNFYLHNSQENRQRFNSISIIHTLPLPNFKNSRESKSPPKTNTIFARHRKLRETTDLFHH